ncbi:MAG: rRNA maturation RNase YbeY [Halanaerobiales bacterium]
MTIQVDINNQQSVIKNIDWTKSIFNKIAAKIAENEGYEKGKISVALVDNQFIKKLNKKYRNLDESTDVLSFPMDKFIWGDIIISVEQAKKQSEAYGHSLQREIGFLFTHGVLHLLGYDHKKKKEKKEMRNKEKEILNELNIKR